MAGWRIFLFPAYTVSLSGIHTIKCKRAPLLMPFLSLFCMLFSAHISMAQYGLKIMLNSAATRGGENIYIAGNFNDWKVNDPAYQLKLFGKGRKGIVLKDLPAGQYEFKLTRGSWATVETDAAGNDIENRSISLDADQTIELNVKGWKDDFPEKPVPNTASRNVQLAEENFLIPQLGRKRSVYVYLPESYQQLKGKSYPVLYMTDGQNVFNQQRSGFGEWGVDEALDSLQKQLKKECIVVAVDHGGPLRIQEYNPYSNGEEGQKMAAFFAETLKPYIDRTYRTLPTAKNTAVLGSSMGGLFSAYLVYRYPGIFGTAGIFSPAFWVAPKIYDEIGSAGKSAIANRYYLFAGGKEKTARNSVEADVNQMAKLLQARGIYDIRISVEPLAEHNEKSWRREFDDFYRWWINGPAGK